MNRKEICNGLSRRASGQKLRFCQRAAACGFGKRISDIAGAQFYPLVVLHRYAATAINLPILKDKKGNEQKLTLYSYLHINKRGSRC